MKLKRFLKQNMPAGRTNKVDEFIATGDKHRTLEEWSAAIKAYKRALEHDDTLAPIWVQLGHAQKEGGDLISAKQSYLQAVQLEPDDADVYLHLGHLCKILGHIDEAEAAFCNCLANDREMHNAYDELLHFGWSRKEIYSAVPGLKCIDGDEITDEAALQYACLSSALRMLATGQQIDIAGRKISEKPLS